MLEFSIFLGEARLIVHSSVVGYHPYFGIASSEMFRKKTTWILAVIFLTSSSVGLRPGFLPNRSRRLISNFNDTSVNDIEINYYVFTYWEYLSFPMIPDNLQKSSCGGAIIDDQHVLSAAHCYKPYLDFIAPFQGQAFPLGATWGAWVFHGNYSQHLGAFDKNVYEKKLQKLAVKNITIHEDYFFNDTTSVNDIAILRVEGSFNKDDILTKCSSDDVPKQDPNNRFLLSGLGKNENKVSAETLKSLKVTEDTNGFCASVEKAKAPPGSYVCVKGLSACYGDSGGPLAFLNKDNGQPFCLYGIVSSLVGDIAKPAPPHQLDFEKSLCTLGEAVQYARVSFYADWIDKKLKSHS